MSRLIFVISFFLSSVVYAVPTLGTASGNIHDATSIVARLMWAACVVTGIILLMTAFSHYQKHRQNPKLMPLSTPILYVMLGLVALGIPFAEKIFGTEENTVRRSGHRAQIPKTHKSRKKTEQRAVRTAPKTTKDTKYR